MEDDETAHLILLAGQKNVWRYTPGIASTLQSINLNMSELCNPYAVLFLEGESTLVEIRSSSIAVKILPEVGGKVGSIIDLHTGTEFLVPPQRDYRTIPENGDWLQHDTSGMDDCFPNVAAGKYPDEPWTSLNLPDLGEWTHGMWNITNVTEREITMERFGATLPYCAVKSLRFIDEHTLEFAYRVMNAGTSPMRYLWSSHPLIAVGADYSIELPSTELNLRSFPANGDAYTWPHYGTRNLAAEWIDSGTTLKVFVTGLSEGWCALRLATHTLRFTFDVNELPALGIWFNNYGFPRDSETPFRCIALEPCTSPSDLLDELEPARYPSIPVGGSVQWSIRLNISTHKQPLADT